MLLRIATSFHDVYTSLAGASRGENTHLSHAHINIYVFRWVASYFSNLPSRHLPNESCNFYWDILLETLVRAESLLGLLFRISCQRTYYEQFGIIGSWNRVIKKARGSGDIKLLRDSSNCSDTCTIAIRGTKCAVERRRIR